MMELDNTVARHHAHADVESQNGSSRYRGSDPYNLSAAFKTDQQLDEIKANTSRKRDGPRIKIKSRHSEVTEFYRNQNETIERLLKTVE